LISFTRGGHQFRRFGIGHDQRRQQAHHLVGGDVDQQAGIQAALDQVAAGAVELDADHQAVAANLDQAGDAGQAGGKPDRMLRPACARAP
jgi:hypothetical protein